MSIRKMVLMPIIVPRGAYCYKLGVKCGYLVMDLESRALRCDHEYLGLKWSKMGSVEKPLACKKLKEGVGYAL